MSHPDSDGAAEMLEGGHRALATAALRLAELYAQRMQVHALLREQQARSAADATSVTSPSRPPSARR